MRNDICTIPVSEVFEVNDGCPLCRMYNTVQERIVDYIMGAAMMEPDIRIVTNEVGFCKKHFDNMMNKRGRLQLALMLESHIECINENVMTEGIFSGNKAEKIRKVTDSCFICDKIEWGMSRMIETLYRCYETDSDFRKMFNEQGTFCLPHYERLLNGANKKNMRSYHKEFIKNLTRITKDYAVSLHTDVKHFCSMYDYRNNEKDADWGNSKDSVERTVAFLTGAER